MGITANIWTDGDTVTTSGAFYSLRSCREIYNRMQPAAPTSGSYYITTYVKSTSAFQRTLVHCDMHSEDASTGKAVGYTYYACHGCNAVVPYGTARATARRSASRWRSSP